MRPLATYRLQLTPAFGFDDAAAILDHVAALGVSHVYCSPYLQAAPGSTHGYDVVDHNRINDELGGEAAYARFCDALRRAGLGQVLDIVPNHMAVSDRNAWWDDVLENGPASPYASYFDIDWDPPERKLRNTVLIPVLAEHYGRVLEAGELSVEREGGALRVRYHDRSWPVAPPTYEVVLAPAADALGDDELAFLAGAFASLPPATVADRDLAAVRHRDKEVLKRRLAQLCRDRAELAAAVDREVALLAADVDRLDAFLQRQNHRLAYWRTATEDLDYRRFFDVTDLVGLRVEDRGVFDDVHRLVRELVERGTVDGLRVDHPDGLADPAGYVERLRAAAPDAYLVVEKILEGGEALPAGWPVDGTTGYDFLNDLLAVFVDGRGERSLTDAYEGFTGEHHTWATVVRDAKRCVLDGSLAADVRRLTQLLARVCEGERRYRDFTRWELRGAVVEVLAAFDRYRTYVRPGVPVREEDAQVIDRALAVVAEQCPDVDVDLLALLRRALRGELAGAAAAELCTRFQQTTSPVMAKGVEDTAFYRYNRLVALNEVGGDPGRFSSTAAAFHAAMARAEAASPARMLAGSTHDTKRSEDVRARLVLLAQAPSEWAEAAARWSALAGDLSAGLDDRNLEWLVFQTLVGAWPLSTERALTFALKAAREAKARTSWTDPDEHFEEAVRAFVEGVLSLEALVADIERFVDGIREAGWVTASAMQLVRLTAPGVPDLYQGTELWDLSLVDPDNRRPVDYEHRRRMAAVLGELAAGDDLGPRIWARAAEGLPKLHVTRTALAARRRGLGAYAPLDAGDEALAFLRGDDVAVVVPRFALRLARSGGWNDEVVVLPVGSWRDELTGRETSGGSVALASLLGAFPVALLRRS